MKKLLMLLAVVGLFGCDDPHDNAPVMMAGMLPASAQHKKPIPSEDEVIAGLRTEAQKHGLRFEVFCVPGYGRHADTYQASAFDKRHPKDALYVEAGAMDWWADTGDTPAEAAYALYLRLVNNSPATQHPDHRPGYGEAENSHCRYNEVYNSETKGKIPCKK